MILLIYSGLFAYSLLMSSLLLPMPSDNLVDLRRRQKWALMIHLAVLIGGLIARSVLEI